MKKPEYMLGSMFAFQHATIRSIAEQQEESNPVSFPVGGAPPRGIDCRGPECQTYQLWLEPMASCRISTRRV